MPGTSRSCGSGSGGSPSKSDGVTRACTGRGPVPAGTAPRSVRYSRGSARGRKSAIIGSRSSGTRVAQPGGEPHVAATSRGDEHGQEALHRDRRGAALRGPPAADDQDQPGRGTRPRPGAGPRAGARAGEGRGGRRDRRAGPRDGPRPGPRAPRLREQLHAALAVHAGMPAEPAVLPGEGSGEKARRAARGDGAQGRDRAGGAAPHRAQGGARAGRRGAGGAARRRWARRRWPAPARARATARRRPSRPAPATWRTGRAAWAPAGCTEAAGPVIAQTLALLLAAGSSAGADEHLLAGAAALPRGALRGGAGRVPRRRAARRARRPSRTSPPPS